MNKTQKLKTIRDTKVIAIMRANSSEQLLKAAEAIFLGGVRVMEVTMTTPGALGTIEAAAAKYRDRAVVGAGSVLDAETARMAILSGADFIVMPTLDVQTITLCNTYGIPVIPGVLTPTEALTAWRAGADMVKLFPAEFGGPGLLRALLAPLPQLEVVPVGGVDLATAGDFIRAGAAALGVGSSLVNQKLLDQGDMDEITRRAAAFVDAAKAGGGAPQ